MWQWGQGLFALTVQAGLSTRNKQSACATLHPGHSSYMLMQCRNFWYMSFILCKTFCFAPRHIHEGCMVKLSGATFEVHRSCMFLSYTVVHLSSSSSGTLHVDCHLSLVTASLPNFVMCITIKEEKNILSTSPLNREKAPFGFHVIFN